MINPWGSDLSPDHTQVINHIAKASTQDQLRIVQLIRNCTTPDGSHFGTDVAEQLNGDISKLMALKPKEAVKLLKNNYSLY
jgi:hypothetical protein